MESAEAYRWLKGIRRWTVSLRAIAWATLRDHLQGIAMNQKGRHRVRQGRGLKRVAGPVLLALFVGNLGYVGIVRSEEPVERFLNRLRDANLSGLAATYLDNASKSGLIPEGMKSDVPLEKLILLQDALGGIRQPEERVRQTEKIEKGYLEFFEKSPDHPRKGEARIKLADLLLNRGQESLRKTGQKGLTDADRTSARNAFQESRKLFEMAIKELKPILEQLQGNKADTAAKVSYRDRLLGEYRQAEILKGLTARFLGESYPADASEYKDWLGKAEVELTEVVNKTTGSREAGRHTLSLLYRGQVQTQLAKYDEAYDSFVRVADIEEGGPFREWRVQATAALIRLQANVKEPKYEPILARAEGLWKTVQPNEKWTPDWLDLQLAMAEGQIAWSALLEGQPNGQNRAKALKTDARGMLQVIAKRPGPHIEKTKQVLSALGVDVAAKKVDEKIPEVKKFADGLNASRERFDRVETSRMSIEILKTRRKDVPANEVASLDQEIESLDKASLEDIRVAEGLLRKALPLFGKEDSREDLSRARYLLAFSLMKREAHWESAAVADFVSRGGGDFGLPAGNLALFSYTKLMENDKGEKGKSLSKSLESLASYMLNTWPNAKESVDAALTLIQQATSEERWNDAQRYLEMLPKEGDKPSQIRRELGVILYARYLIEMDRKRKASEPSTEKDTALLERSEGMLTEGWKGLSVGTLDQRAVEAGNSLVSIYLKSNRLKQAQEILNRSDIGPVVAIKSPSLQLEPRVKMETLRLLLQSNVLEASAGGAKLESKRIADIVGEMKTISEESPEGKGRLAGSLVQLSQDLQEQLNQVKDFNDKIKVSEGIQVLLDQLVSVSEDVNILEWAGTTLNTLGAGMEGVAATQAQATQLMKGSVKAFTKLMELESKKPGMIQEAGRKAEDIQTKFAQALRGQGEFQLAIDKLEEVLAANPKSLLAQFEAAKTYQQWGQSSKNGEYFRKAMEGNKKSIWGWGLLSVNLSKNLGKATNLVDYFFESRYRLADARYNSGQLEADAAKKKKAFEFAIGDLRSTTIQFPKIKESTWYNSMDQLMRQLQRELNKPQIGMKEFDEPTKPVTAQP